MENVVASIFTRLDRLDNVDRSLRLRLFFGLGSAMVISFILGYVLGFVPPYHLRLSFQYLGFVLILPVLIIFTSLSRKQNPNNATNHPSNATPATQAQNNTSNTTERDRNSIQLSPNQARISQVQPKSTSCVQQEPNPPQPELGHSHSTEDIGQFPYPSYPPVAPEYPQQLEFPMAGAAMPAWLPPPGQQMEPLPPPPAYDEATKSAPSSQ